jgi:hypothetical protein
MSKTALALTLLGTALVCSLYGAPAKAQARVFVSATGSDGNPCTFTSPCRSFQHAHNTVAAGGEIDVLDPAGYGAVTISKAISIQGHGYAGISASSGNAITINPNSGDTINLRGLLIDGLGSGANGIQVNATAFNVYVEIQDTLIRDFSGRGMYMNGNGTTSGVFDHLVVVNNSAGGLQFGDPSNSGAVIIGYTVSNSVIANNLSGSGVYATMNGTVIMVQNCTIENNSFGLLADNSGILRVTKSAITGNGTGMFNGVTSFGTIESFGDNALRGNATDGAPTATVPLK